MVQQRRTLGPSSVAKPQTSAQVRADWGDETELRLLWHRLKVIQWVIMPCRRPRVSSISCSDAQDASCGCLHPITKFAFGLMLSDEGVKMRFRERHPTDTLLSCRRRNSDLRRALRRKPTQLSDIMLEIPVVCPASREPVMVTMSRPGRGETKHGVLVCFLTLSWEWVTTCLQICVPLSLIWVTSLTRPSWDFHLKFRTGHTRCHVGDITPAKLREPNRVEWMGRTMQGTASLHYDAGPVLPPAMAEFPDLERLFQNTRAWGGVLGGDL